MFFFKCSKNKNKIGRWASQRRPGPGNILPLRSYTSREKEIWSNIFVMHGNGYTSTIDRNVSTSAIMGMVTPLLNRECFHIFHACTSMRGKGGKGGWGKATDTVVCDPCLWNQPLHTTFPLDYSFTHSFIPQHQLLDLCASYS